MVPDKDCLYKIGDMVMTEGQILEAFGLVGKNGQPNPALRWPNGTIPYTFDREVFPEGAPEEAVMKTVAARFNADMQGCLTMK